MENKSKLNLRNRIFVGVITSLATFGCCLLFYWAFMALFNDNHKRGALLVVLLALAWLIHTFGSVAIKVIVGSREKHYVNIASLVVLNFLLTASVVLVVWIYLTDTKERSLWSGIDFFVLIAFMGGMAVGGWAHIIKRLNA